VSEDAPTTTDESPPRRPREAPGRVWIGLIVVALGLVLLFFARLDNPTSAPAPDASLTGHTAEHPVNGVVPGIPFHPDPAVATMAARMTPVTGSTTIRSAGVAATPTASSATASPPIDP